MLTPVEEAQLRDLIAQQSALLSLAGVEATILSKLGATKVTLSDLPSASVIDDADLLLLRQGVTDKSVTGLTFKNLIPTIADASTTVKGIVELATDAEVQTGSDTLRAVTPNGLLFAGKRYRNLTNINVATVLTAADVGTVVLCGGGAPYNVTIPDADNFVNGQTITIGSQTAVVTLIPSGTDNFSDSGVSIPTYTIPAGGFVELTRFGSSFWVITNKNLYIGVGQTWQSLIGSRALATTYTNTTNRPIMVNVHAAYTSSNGLQLVINGISVARSSGNSATVIYSTLSGIVPVGATYSVSFFAGSAASDLQWLELR